MKLISCHSIEFDKNLTEHFIYYYQKLGINTEDFLLILNYRDDINEFKQIKEICHSYKIQTHDWYGEYDSKTMHQKRKKLFEKYCSSKEWIIHADADEFHEYPNGLSAILKGSHNCVQGVYIDRISSDGRLKKINNKNIFDQFPTKCNAMKIQFGKGGATTGCVKMMAYKYGLETSKGGHQIESSKIGKVKYYLGYNLAKHPKIRQSKFRYSCPLKIHHFRWNESLLKKLERRTSVYKKIGVKTWRTFEETLEILKNNNNTINMSMIDVYT